MIDDAYGPDEEIDIEDMMPFSLSRRFDEDSQTYVYSRIVNFMGGGKINPPDDEKERLMRLPWAEYQTALGEYWNQYYSDNQ